MKKFSFLVLFFTAASVSSLQAQQGFIDLFDSSFVNISRSSATTGILYDRVLSFSNLTRFSGSNPDTADMHRFLYGFHELYNAAFDTTKRLPFDGDGLENLISNNAGYVDIGILHYKFNVIDTLVAKQKLYFGMDSVLWENQAISASLYNEMTVLMITPFKEKLYPDSITFRFSSLFHFDNTNNPITALQVNFDDGNGWQTLGLNSTVRVYYPDGDYTLCFIATYSNGQSDTCYAQISSSSIQYAKDDCTAPPFQESNWKYIDKGDDNSDFIFIGYPFTDYDGKTAKDTGNVWVYYANTDKKLRKPILIVDGFDPGNVRQHESYTGERNAFTNVCGESIWSKLKLIDNSGVHLGQELLTMGYDLVVLDLPDGGGYIERNAMVTIKVIEWINEQLQANGSGHEIVVVGPSMGGQITRYALAYMEAHENIHGKHNCRLWVSFDSPHQGANISIGTQAWAYYFRGMYKIGDLWEDKLKSTAAGQMLIHHFDNASHQKFNKYYDLTNHTIGYPERMHYPNNLRKIAISNGSLYNTKTVKGGDRAFRYNPNLAVEQITSSVYLYPETGTLKVCEVYHLMPFPPFIIRIRWEVNNNTNKCSIDAAPGCLYNTFFQVKNGYALFKIGVIVLLDKTDHCFMPTTSVLDISGDMDYCTDISNRNLVAEGLTPFQSYCGPGGAFNMEHISLNQHIADWLFDEIETYIAPGNREISLCEYAYYSVHLPAGQENTSVTWTCSNNLELISGQGTKTIQVRAVSMGDGWVHAKPDILAHGKGHNKELKKYTLKVINNHLNSTVAPAEITQSQTPTWGSSYTIESTLYIKNGATLTIKSVVYCSPSAKIIVQPGGKLIIDGGILTSACNDELWQGIEVWGNSNLSQTSANQGFVELKNNAIIENAVCGIRVGNKQILTAFDLDGGIVKANNVRFINNQQAVFFAPYVSKMDNTGKYFYSNASRFENCTFALSNAAYFTQASNSQVELQGVKGVSFTNCIFADYRTKQA
jgi:hypothetical protein